MLAVMDHLTNRRVDLTVLKDRLRERRDTLGLDQDAVAERSGLSSAYISRLERGAVPNPKVFDLEKVAEALDTSVGALLRSPGAPDSETYVSECAALMRQLDGEPPEVVETVLRWWRDSIKVAKLHQRTDDA